MTRKTSEQPAVSSGQHDDGAEPSDDSEQSAESGETEQAAPAARPPIVYDAEANPDGAYIPGVGWRDYAADEWAALPAHVRASAAATGWYQVPEVPAAPASEAAT